MPVITTVVKDQVKTCEGCKYLSVISEDYGERYEDKSLTLFGHTFKWKKDRTQDRWSIVGLFYRFCCFLNPKLIILKVQSVEEEGEALRYPRGCSRRETAPLLLKRPKE